MCPVLKWEITDSYASFCLFWPPFLALFATNGILNHLCLGLPHRQLAGARQQWRGQDCLDASPSIASTRSQVCFDIGCNRTCIWLYQDIFEICLHMSSPARNYFLPHASHGEHVFLIAHHDLFGYVWLILKHQDVVDWNYSTATFVGNIEQQGVLDISLLRVLVWGFLMYSCFTVGDWTDGAPPYGANMWYSICFYFVRCS